MSIASQPRSQARARRKAGRKATRGRGAPSLREAAYEAIKHRIITCELRPGEVLSEAAISARLGIGRTPVHQAVDRLTVEGLIDVMPRKGIVVRPLSLDEAVDIIEVRLINETYCARLAAKRASPQDHAALDANLAAFAAAVDRRDTAELMRLDRAFHNALSRASRNVVLSDLLRNLHERSLRFWFVSLRAADHDRRVLEQHTRIVEAIRRGDADAAEEAMRAHIDAFRINVTRQI